MNESIKTICILCTKSKVIDDLESKSVNFIHETCEKCKSFSQEMGNNERMRNTRKEKLANELCMELGNNVCDTFIESVANFELKMKESLLVENITEDHLKRFNLITSEGNHARFFSDFFRYTYNPGASLKVGAGTRGILVTLKQHILCDSYLSTIIPLNHEEYVVPNIQYEYENRWIIFQEVLDIAFRFDKQETFFDDLFKKCRLVNTRLLITTNSIDIIKNFCTSILKTDHDDGAFFSFGESARTSEKGKIIATEYSPKQVLNLIALGIEIR